MKIYFPTMENLFSCDGNFSFIQWYQNNVPNRNFLHTGRRGVPLRYCIDGANRVRNNWSSGVKQRSLRFKR